MNILVTGGAGYLGSVLVPMLLEAGHKVHVLDIFRFGGESLARCCSYQDFEVTNGDVRDGKLVVELLSKADLIIPLAAIVGAPACRADTHAARSTNLHSIIQLVAMLSPEQRLIFPNTNSGYGTTTGKNTVDEETPLKPISLYGDTKARAEAIILDHSNSVVFRFATLFGMSPRMRVDLLVNDFVHRAVYDRSVVLFEGHFRRNYLHVQDAARAFLHTIDHFDSMKGVPYNAGLNTANLSKIELCQQIKQHIPSFTWFESPIGEDPDKRDYLISNERLTATGFQPKYSLDDGIVELIKGFRILKDRRYGNA